METLVDELATRAKMDPIAYRLKLLSSDATKLRACLALLEEKSATWRKNVPRNHAVGIACHESFETGVACAVEVSIEDKRPRIHRATIAVDPGVAVNPLTIESQMQGGLGFGVTQLMANGAITLKNGRVEQRNFDGYTPPYMKDAPVAVDVHIVSSTEKPSGCGTARPGNRAGGCQCAGEAHREALPQPAIGNDIGHLIFIGNGENIVRTRSLLRQFGECRRGG